MRKYESARILMTDRVEYILDISEDILKDDPIISGAIGEFKNGKKDIQKTIEELRINISNFTKEKHRRREVLNTDLDHLLAAIRSMAQVNGNQAQFDQASMSLTEIRRILLVEIVPAYNKWLTFATDHLEELEPYGITEAGIKEYQDHLLSYEKAEDVPASKVSVRKTANEKLKTQVDAVMAILNDKLDNMVEKYREPNPDFYREYMNARIIVDAAFRHVSAKGIITDEETGEVLYGVVVKFRPGSALATTLKLANTTSTDKGFYELKGLPYGAGELIFELPYYDTLHMQVNIQIGKTITLNVALRKTE